MSKYVLKLIGVIFFGLLFFLILHLNSNIRSMPHYHDAFILAEHDGVNTISSLRSTVSPLINTIIQQELNLPQSEQNPRFKSAPHYNLTIYYVFDWLIKKDSLLIKTFENILSNSAIPNFEIKFGAPAFFGMNNDEMVVKIDDSQNYLLKINTMFKNAFVDSHALYNFKKSEHFEYIPHIALGRLPANDKRYFSSVEGIKILDNIKKRIEFEVFPVIIKEIDKISAKLSVNSVSIYDVKQKKVLKSVELS